MNRNTPRSEKDGPQKDECDNIHASEILSLSVMCATVVGYADWWEINSYFYERNLPSLTFRLDKIHVWVFTQGQDFVDRYVLQCNNFEEYWNLKCFVC